MHRTASLSAVLLLVLGLALVGGGSLLGAQEATPTPVSSVGVSGGALGQGEPEAAPDHVLWLRHATFEPGGYVPLHHHPGALVLSVESGSLLYAVEEGVATVTRKGTDGSPGATEAIGPGEETTINAGDSVFEQGVLHTAINEGDEPTKLLIAALAVADEPFTQYHEDARPLGS